jgi:tRNA nucleotidyltransferase (CCA-adding enzyme)
MKVYLVGGAVRDELLGLPVHEYDYVVVGATPQQMEQAGYRAVGRDFPVFLHPDTRQEYALARLERKTGPGYRGFDTWSSPDVTLEQDLQRRDLTINAMARGEDGLLVDPYGGRHDLEQRRLRHVSPAFIEDPVRILRLARFSARFTSLGFAVVADTLALMRTMVLAGEVDALVPERVWRETERALGEPTPEAFFDVLLDCGALKVVMPQLIWNDAARTIVQTAARASPRADVRFAALLAPLGTTGIDALCDRLRPPAEYRELARLTSTLMQHFSSGASSLSAAGLLQLFERGDAFRRRERFEQALLAAQALCTIDAYVLRALSSVSRVALEEADRRGLKGPQIATALRERRLQQLQSLLL